MPPRNNNNFNAANYDSALRNKTHLLDSVMKNKHTESSLLGPVKLKKKKEENRRVMGT